MADTEGDSQTQDEKEQEGMTGEQTADMLPSKANVYLSTSL